MITVTKMIMLSGFVLACWCFGSISAWVSSPSTKWEAKGQYRNSVFEMKSTICSMNRYFATASDRVTEQGLASESRNYSAHGGRRELLQAVVKAAGSLLVADTVLVNPPLACAASSTQEAEVTDKVYFTVKGLPGGNKRIVIGLFGKDAPECTKKIVKLFSKMGLVTPCRPKAEKIYQKEQLEANKVYNSCIEGESDGVTLEYSTIWRIIRGERIDVGAVTGRFIAREFPEWQESVDSGLTHDAPGVVSVRRGNDGGFGFAIYPGGGNPDDLNQDHIVVGRVIEGMDVVEELNNVAVVAAAKVNVMALTGGSAVKNAPTRACTYGGANLYCNENKPLIKLSVIETGVL